MSSPLAFLLGVLSALAVLLLVRALSRPATAATAMRHPDHSPDTVGAATLGADTAPADEDVRDVAPAAAQPPAPRPERQRVTFAFDPEFLRSSQMHLEALATGAGSELGDLATAVEGHANLLCEALGDPERVAERAEQLWTSVRRMRLFSEKLLSFANPPDVEPIPMELLDLMRLIQGDLESYMSGAFNVQVELAPFLPPANVDPDHLRKSILFLVDTLLAIQPDTHQITLRAFAALIDDESPIVCIELAAEVDEGMPVRPRANGELQLGYLAARNTLEAMRARLAVEHVEDLDVHCQIMLAAVFDPEETLGSPAPSAVPASATEAAEPSRHHFGGILILEDDRSVRELLSMELGRSGRNILTCGDGAAARSLIEATPERFELLVLDSAAPLESGEHIAAHALELEPAFKILMLTDALGFHAGTDLLPRDRVVALGKPFNLSDLREAVRELMGACPPPPLAPPAESAELPDEIESDEDLARMVEEQGRPPGP